MTTFDDREKAFEAKYRLDQDMDFKTLMRRDKLVGLWAADLMGLTGDAAKAYALTVVEAAIDTPDQDVADKVANDLAARSVKVPVSEIRTQVTLLLDKARAELNEELSR
ncbi:DUF1476 domain-containing protein [Magnetospirillum molischianum]|uniref:Aldolase n=1 Tax=Magnetospirillum molischianum DSM 120 TaxID=1150626 RepID=H8FPB1_MAGML|nr:DUF1476 domain-containing protein [Magnetospirillum molischianum]CCG40199.1 conserved hypothetical protein [Magnetospirillum molischianum DSM 120]